MIRHVIMHIVVLTGLVLWGSCLHASAQITTQSESWGYTSSYSTANRAGTSYRQTMPASRGYTPACRSISAYNPDFKEGVKASSYFQYTPADALLSDNSSDNGGIQRNLRRGWGDPDEDDPIGVLPNPTPVGEPFVLLALALLYTLLLFFRVHLFSRQNK